MNASTTAGSNCVPLSADDDPARLGRARSAGAVGAVGRQRVERVGDREHARGERDVLAGQPVGVAVAVPALVVVAHDELGLAEEVDVAQDLPADDRVALHQRALGLVERLGLEEDRVGDRDLADVVQQEAELDLRVVGQRQRRRARDLQAVGGDALGVLARVGVARLDGVGERAHGRDVGRAQLLRRARAPA